MLVISLQIESPIEKVILQQDKVSVETTLRIIKKLGEGVTAYKACASRKENCFEMSLLL